MKTIIIATDFSSAAENAAHYGADMAAALGAQIHLLYVYNIATSYYEVPLAWNLTDMTQEGEEKIAGLKEQLNTRLNGAVKINTEVRIGFFLTELKTVCELLEPHMVVMGSQGSTAATRLLFGSHAVNASKNLAWPLVTVPPDAKYASVQRIGLATDFEKTDDIPVEEIKMLIDEFNAELLVLHIGKRERFDHDTGANGIAQELLGDLKPEYHFIEAPDLDDAIVHFADEHDIDMLMVLARREGFMDKLLHKNHTKQLVLRSHVPVMALHQETEHS